MFIHALVTFSHFDSGHIPVSRELKKRVKFVLLRDDYLNLIDTLRNLHCNVTKNPVGLEHMFLKLSLTSGGHQNFCFDQAWGGEGGSDRSPNFL